MVNLLHLVMRTVNTLTEANTYIILPTFIIIIIIISCHTQRRGGKDLFPSHFGAFLLVPLSFITVLIQYEQQLQDSHYIKNEKWR